MDFGRTTTESIALSVVSVHISGPLVQGSTPSGDAVGHLLTYAFLRVALLALGQGGS